MENILFGFIAGIGAAFGLGGGTILILLLNFFTGIQQYEIQGINLIFFIPTAIMAIYIDYKNKLIDLKVAKTCILTGILGSILGSFLAGKIQNQILKKCFGIFLILIAISGVFSFISQFKNSKKKHNKNG